MSGSWRVAIEGEGNHPEELDALIYTGTERWGAVIRTPGLRATEASP